MKQFIFLLFLIPSLCFAQLGINTPTPQADLHIAKKGNLPALIIDDLPNKKPNDLKSYETLIINKDDIVHKTTVKHSEGSGQESQKFYLKLPYNRPKADMKSYAMNLINFENPNLTDEDNNIILSEKGTYVLMITFNGYTDVIPDAANGFTLGQRYTMITDTSTSDLDNSRILDIAESTWLLSPEIKTFSHSLMFVVNNTADSPFPIRIIMKPDDLQSKYNEIMDEVKDQNDTFRKTNVVMWKL